MSEHTDIEESGRLITDNVRKRTYEVDQNFDGWRLDKFLANRIPRISRSFAGRIAKEGDVDVEPPRKIKAGTRLREDDVVTVREELEPERVQDHEVEFISRDEGLIVVSKPSGMLVHESASVRLNTIQKFLERQGFGEAEPVHRLDRETSGVLVCAAKSELVPELRGMFATTHPEKVYRALVFDPDGVWQPGERRTIETPLGIDPDSKLGIKMGRGELDATTHVEVIGRLDNPSLERHWGPMADLRVVIETGRQHQIRIHLALQGTPIAGDKLYSVDDAFFMAICDDPDDPELLARVPFDRQALHAWQMRLEHPLTGEMVEFEAPLPDIWG
ncbi:MAG: RluA family pseudouridine synthase [Persicimonas sp.]